MNFAIHFHPRLFDAIRRYTAADFRHDFFAGLNAMVLAFPLSMAFAIAAGVKPEQGLFTAIIGGALSGRYSRYSRGAMDVLRDLVTPAGPLPVMTLADSADAQKGSTS